MKIPFKGIRVKTYTPGSPIIVQGPIDLNTMTEEISVKNYILRRFCDYLKQFAWRH